MRISKTLLGFLTPPMLGIIGFIFIIGCIGFWNLNLPLALCCLIFGIAFFYGASKKWFSSERINNSAEYAPSEDNAEIFLEEAEEAPEFDYTFTKDGEYVFIQKGVMSDRFYYTTDGKHEFIRYKSGIYSEI